jgi:hypothetical protein
LPQAPQWSGSEPREAQDAPHAVVPPEHPQEADTQTCVAAHALSHPPQWSGSVVVSTHAPAHAAKGAVHAATHWPAWHSGVAPVHTVPQAPQWFGSEASSLQLEPHAVCPCGHAQVPAVQVPDAGHACPH